MLDWSRFDDDARALIERAREVAHQDKNPRCSLSHVVAAHVEISPGKRARAVRVACRLRNVKLARKLETLPPLAEPLVEALARCAERGHVTHERLCALILSAELDDDLRAAFDAWLENPVDEPPAPLPVPPPEDGPEWLRLELDDGEGIAFAELTRDGARLFERSGREGQKRGQVSWDVTGVKELRSAAAAQRSLERRVASLERKEHRRVASVRRALPHVPSPEESARIAAELRERRDEERRQELEAFERGLDRLLQAWVAQGHDPSRSFQQEGQRLRQDWNEIANRFLALAERELGVWFTRRTTIDEEHGTLGPIGSRHHAEFYVGPENVARIAEDKVRGGLSSTDGEWPRWREAADASSATVASAFARSAAAAGAGQDRPGGS